MSRMLKLAEWLSQGYYNATVDEYIEDWTPHNLKTVLISGKFIGVEYFVPNSKLIRHEVWRVEDVEKDIKVIEQRRLVKSICKALTQYRTFSNLEEIIISDSGYLNKRLYEIDANLNEITVQGTEIKQVFPRMYAITKTNLSFDDIWNLMCTTADDEHVHYSDILDKNRTKYIEKTVQITRYNTKNWCLHIELTDGCYKMDEPDGRLAKYLHGVQVAIAGELGFDEVIEKEKSLTDFFTTINLADINLSEVKRPEVKVTNLEVMKDDLWNPNMSSTKVRYLLCESLLYSIEGAMGSLYAINSLVITAGNQILVDGIRICPVMSYTLMINLPDALFKALCGQSKEWFNQVVTQHFKRIPNLDSDLIEFEDWLAKQELNWGYIFSFKDVFKFANLSTLRINNPYRAYSAKVETGLRSWSALYDKISSLMSDGIYIDGMYINKQTEINFCELEKALDTARQLMIEYNERGYAMSQVINIDSSSSKVFSKVLGKKTADKVQNKMANLSAKVTTLYRKLDM